MTSHVETPTAVTDSPYIEGFAIKHVSSTQASVDVGRINIPGASRLIQFPWATTINMLAGADVLAYLYVYEDPINPGYGLIEISTTAPDAPYVGTARTKAGDTTRRYLGMLRNDSNGSLIPFETEVMGGETMLVFYSAAHNSSHLAVVSLTGTLAKQTYNVGPSSSVANDRLVSPAARTAVLYYTIGGGASGASLGWPAAGTTILPLQTPATGNAYLPLVRLSANQEFMVGLNDTAAFITVGLIGYYERR